MPDLSQREIDQRFMQRALALAEATVALASPNPQVGCVLVRNNEILAEGAHRYDVFDHAEIAALKQAAERGISPAGATAYVALEPCSHHGRTGPCANALIAARIARVVVATQDPNPAVSGRGIALLRNAGIDVAIGVLEQPARSLNDSFAHFIRRHTPFVTLKAALSVDGKLAPNPAQRRPDQPHWLTGPAARADVQRLRHASDAILTGIGTVLADNPSLTDRTGLPRRRPLLRVILDPHLRIPTSSQLVQSAHQDLLIFHTASAWPQRAEALRALGAELQTIPESGNRLDLPSLLAALGSRSLLSVLLESGPALNAAFLTQDLVDKAILFYAEAELGEQAIPFAPGISPQLLQQRLHRASRTTFSNGRGHDACISGYLHDPWRSDPLS